MGTQYPPAGATKSYQHAPRLLRGGARPIIVAPTRPTPSAWGYATHSRSLHCALMSQVYPPTVSPPIASTPAFGVILAGIWVADVSVASAIGQVIH